jgi:hypothetical protein
METIRQEVRALVLTTERLLSPVTLGEPLNEDERDMVAMCSEPSGEVSDEFRQAYAEIGGAVPAHKGESLTPADSNDPPWS